MYILNESSEQIFRKALRSIIDTGIAYKTRTKVINYGTRDYLKQIANGFEITDNGVEIEQLLDDFKILAEYSLNFSSPNFLAMPDCGHSIAGMLGDFARSFLNQNTVNHEYSPLASQLEIQLLETLRSVVGFPVEDNPEMLAVKTGGAFTFGGFGSNMSCLLIAREFLKKRLSEEGKTFNPRKIRVLGSQAFAHYSLRRSLDMLGLGNKDLTEEKRREQGLDFESLFSVDTKDYRLNLNDLERKIEQVRSRGEEIMAVFALAGESRALGFDDLESIGHICEQHGIWLHADACQGGQCLFSEKRRQAVLNGVERANSISLDPHKILLIPYNLSAFFVRDYRNLYLLPKGATVISNDDDALGKFTPGIGSKGFHSLKLYFLLRHWGLKRIACEIERRHELALHCAEVIVAHPKLELLNPRVDHNAVVFMVKPDKLNPSVAEYNALNRKIHNLLTQDGMFFVHTFPTQDDSRVITEDMSQNLWPLRMMFGNPDTFIENVDACLERIISIAKQVEEIS